jgi:hypothetical protein
MSEHDICNICGEERRALIHTDTELHPDDAVDELFLHAFEPLSSLSVIERWTLRGAPIRAGDPGRPMCVAGPLVGPGEDVEVVRADDYQGAVAASARVVAAWDAYLADDDDDPAAAAWTELRDSIDALRVGGSRR